MAIVNSINLIDDFGQNLLRYYNNDMSSHDCETLFQTEITEEIYNTFTPLGVSDVDCGPNTLCALGILSRQDAIKLSQNTSHRGMKGMEIAHFIQLFLKNINKKVTQTHLMPISIDKFTIIKNTLLNKHATVIFLSNNNNFGHYLLLMKWNNNFKLVDPQSMLILINDVQVDQYFRSQNWNNFLTFCVKDIAPNIKKRSRGPNAVFSRSIKKKRTARKSKKKKKQKKQKNKKQTKNKKQKKRKRKKYSKRK
tara:strand:- start:2926 stop:3678 length:753 start_codon:yes stop_codon:yes gene_type:complete